MQNVTFVLRLMAHVIMNRLSAQKYDKAFHVLDQIDPFSKNSELQDRLCTVLLYDTRYRSASNSWKLIQAQQRTCLLVIFVHSLIF